MRIILLCLLMVPLGACRLALDPDDYEFTRDSGVDGDPVVDGGEDAGPEAGPEAGPGDAGPDLADASPECTVSAQCMQLNQPGQCVGGECVYTDCTGGFGDCDEAPGCETILTTISDCGMCGHVCNGANGTEACTDGACTIACTVGFADCGGDNDGCESDLANASSCGGCSPCPEDAPLCNSLLMCALMCEVDTQQCGDSCVDPQISFAHCGFCGNSCNSDPEHAYDTCIGGTCMTTCDDNYADCDLSPDSCETNLVTDAAHCGSCGMICPSGLNEVPLCDTRVCMVMCEEGFEDCDISPGAPGCETDVRVDAQHCGGCDIACGGGNASWTCEARTCAVDECNDGYANCSGGSVDGCEVSILDDEAHCGGCGLACDAGVTCIRGACIEPMVTTGSHSGCQLSGTGEVECWGMGDTGEIGNGVYSHQTRPQPVGGLSATKIGVGSQFACAVTFTGQANCWGRNGYRELGNGGAANSPSPTIVVPEMGDLGTVVSVRTGHSHACLLNDTGDVWCWGRNDVGQTGDGTFGGAANTHQVMLPGDATSLTVGTLHSCAVVAGRVYCWGVGISGQLGNGARSNTATPVAAGSRTDFEEVAAGGIHTCARTTANAVWCWGSVLGNAAGFPPSDTPAEVSALAGATWIEAGSRNVCAGLPIGSACVGQDAVGQLGDGTATDIPALVPVRPLGTPSGRIWPGFGATLCTLSDGQSLCWGSDRLGQLGRNDDIVLPVPTAIPALAGATEISLGDQYGCVIIAGQARCFGQHRPGLQTRSSTPLPIAVSTPGGLDVGYFGAAALDGTTAAAPQAHWWGSNVGGRFAPSAPRPTPGLLLRTGIENRLALGSSHLCVLEGTEVFCQGLNTSGQLGNGSILPVVGFVQVDALLGTAVAIAAGTDSSCAILSDGDAKCWGAGGHGRLGNGAAANSATPVPVMGLSHVIDIDFGGRHVCAIEAPTEFATSGQVYCWGLNLSGQLGSPVGTTSATPVDTGISDAIAVTAGSDHSCAIREGGEVMCWGNNLQYQVGDGTHINRTTPVLLTGFTANTTRPQIDSGEQSGQSTCALANDGDVYCWGECANGGCARGGMYSATPGPVGE